MSVWLPLVLILGSGPEAELASQLSARGVDPATLRFERRASVVDGSLEHVRVFARACGIETARPIARALVDRDADRIAWSRVGGRAGTLSCTPSRRTAADAVSRVQASGLPGSRGPATARAQWLEVDASWRLIWRVDPPADLSIPTDPVFVVDDRTGELVRWSERVRSAKVRVFATNPIATPSTTVEDLNAVTPGASVLEGPWFAAANCIAPDSGEGWCHRERTAVPDLAGDYLYPEPDLDAPAEPEDLFAEASGYYHLDRFFAWLQTLGIDQLGCHLEGDVLEIVVNRREYDGGEWEVEDNAFYTGSCGASTLMMGQGAHDFAYDGDIVYHELSHAVIELLAGEDLGIEQRRADALVFDAGAIDEGVADFLAAAFTDDPLVAEYAFPSGGRSLDQAFTCPRDLTGEIHADGQILGAALWEARAQVGEPLVPIAIDALAMIEPDASFEDYAEAVEALTTAALGADAAAQVHARFEARGLIACARVVDFDAFGEGGVHEDLGLARLLHVRSPRMGRVYSPTPPPPLQWRVHMPDDADTATLRFLLTTTYVIDQNLSLGVKHGAPIEFDYAVDGMDVTVSADTDEVVLGADDGEVAFAAEPGSTVYVGMFHLGTGDPVTDRWLLLYDFGIEFSCAAGEGECAPPTDETGGTGDSGEGMGSGEPGGGCGCRTGSHGPGSAGVWLFALAVVRGRGRRATQP